VKKPPFRARVLPVITILLIVPPLAALIAIGWLEWRPGVKPPAQAPPGQATTLLVEEPEVDGSEVRIGLDVNGELVPEGDVRVNTSERLVHVHVILGDGRFDEPGHSDSTLFEPEESAGAYSGVAGDRRAVTYRNLPPGDYTLRAELVPNDHDPGSGISGGEAEFTVK
jgi:hypothetical protein